MSPVGPKPKPPGNSSKSRPQPKRSPVKSRTHHGTGLWERIVTFWLWEHIVAFFDKVGYAAAWLGIVIPCLCGLTLVAFLLFTGNEIGALIFLVRTCFGLRALWKHLLAPLFQARRRG